MILYTPEYSNYFGNDTNAIRDEVERFTNESTAMYQNSGVDVQFVVIHLSQSDNYNDGFNLSALSPSFFAFTEIGSQRTTSGGDIGILLRSPSSSTGLGTSFGYNNGSNKYGYLSMQHSNNTAPEYTLAHELGHNFNVNHENGACMVNSTTIMEYQASCGGDDRIPFFTNENFLYNGQSLGNANTSVKIILSNLNEVSNYQTRKSEPLFDSQKDEVTFIKFTGSGAEVKWRPRSVYSLDGRWVGFFNSIYEYEIFREITDEALLKTYRVLQH